VYVLAHAEAKRDTLDVERQRNPQNKLLSGRSPNWAQELAALPAKSRQCLVFCGFGASRLRSGLTSWRDIKQEVEATTADDTKECWSSESAPDSRSEHFLLGGQDCRASSRSATRPDWSILN